MKTHAVIGCGFGDEGKGRIVSYLCSQLQNPIVIRFSGGHQAAHKVMLNENASHIFSNFGSGTLQGVPTYWSQFCTFDPVGFINELNVLRTLKPALYTQFYIHPDCPIVTPYDKEFNIKREAANKHGTCGVGFGDTLQREEDLYSLRFKDLSYRTIVDLKLQAIKDYYMTKGLFYIEEHDLEYFYKSIEAVLECSFIKSLDYLPTGYANYIFEGSQGLLLDQKIGFFPHVTRSNTDVTNILKLTGRIDNIHYVTRSYLTRHGNGPLPFENLIDMPTNLYEENSDYGTQGKFRKAPLNLELLAYGIRRNRDLTNCYSNLTITCMDLFDTSYPVIYKNKLMWFAKSSRFVSLIVNETGISTINLSYSPYGLIQRYIFCKG